MLLHVTTMLNDKLNTREDNKMTGQQEQENDEFEQVDFSETFALKRDMRNVDWMGRDASPFKQDGYEEEFED